MRARLEILDTPISGLHVLQRQPIADDRGYLERLFCTEELQSLLSGKRIAQVNHTLTANRGAVRGLHFQRPPHAEVKFVQCLNGEVFDVAVDLRQGSPTFLRWHAEVLTADNHRTFVIPEGFAHGFQALSNHCQMLYFHTTAYAAAFEAGFNVRDPKLAIRWPLPITELSPRDAALPSVDLEFTGMPA